jgi:hypothetical protein
LVISAYSASAIGVVGFVVGCCWRQANMPEADDVGLGPAGGAEEMLAQPALGLNKENEGIIKNRNIQFLPLPDPSEFRSE